MTGCYFRFNSADMTALGLTGWDNEVYFVRHKRSTGNLVSTGAVVIWDTNSYIAAGDSGDAHGTWSSVCNSWPAPAWLSSATRNCNAADRFEAGDTLELMLPTVGPVSGPSYNCWL